ncbi:MAG TPA: MauE/DoxX family redox-associated membrane protein [Intrasporangium sp.]|uniref:MauE/DoxX family redox-associated membrane protein n=1 Tax=Intrasporangium sp. TaxID=1925024 RepID=UPI002B45E298|nr:MauE/DoxX family redox-associated membrane protein [Intrasporangium sp.]HKX68276.1 MauE/DoxX family redox-associated membrane protein [Intrasporangium sp.]
MTAAALVSPLLLSFVLGLSGVAKLRSPRASADAFDALRVPGPFSSSLVRQGHPWLEVLLAIALVTLPGRWQLAAAVAVLALLVVYLWLILRALSSTDPVDCACFGAIGSDRVTPWTVLRNAWLVLLAVVGIPVAMGDTSVLARLVELGSEAWWLAAVAAGVVTIGLVMARPGQSDHSDEHVPAPDDDGEYLRRPTPHLPVSLADGTTVSVRALAKRRPQLLVHVSELCGSCSATVAAVPGWREALPEVDIRLLLRSGADSSPWASVEEPQTIHDPPGYAAVTMEMPRTPSAVLLGVDGLLAGGPVTGPDAIRAFVEDITHELEAARASASADAPGERQHA